MFILRFLIESIFKEVCLPVGFDVTRAENPVALKAHPILFCAFAVSTDVKNLATWVGIDFSQDVRAILLRLHFPALIHEPRQVRHYLEGGHLIWNCDIRCLTGCVHYLYFQVSCADSLVLICILINRTCIHENSLYLNLISSIAVMKCFSKASGLRRPCTSVVWLSSRSLLLSLGHVLDQFRVARPDYNTALGCNLFHQSLLGGTIGG